MHTEFEDGRMNCTMCSLKINNKLLDWRRLMYNLFHSMIVDEKKEFLKKLCFVLKKGKLETFLVLYVLRESISNGMTGVNRGIEYPLLHEIFHTVSKRDNLSCSNSFCLGSRAGPDNRKRQRCAWQAFGARKPTYSR